MATGASALAEEPQPLKTLPYDQGFGQQEVIVREFPSPDSWVPLPDKRGRIDAAADRVMLVPSAFTPERGTLAYTNTLLLGNEVSYAFTDDVQVAMMAILPTDEVGSRLQLSSKINVFESRTVAVSLQPHLGYHSEDFERTLQTAGLGLGLLADFYVTDNLVISASAFAYGTFWAQHQVENLDGCFARSEYPDCLVLDDIQTTWPAGGHHLLASAGLTYFFSDSWSLRTEIIAGGAAGTFMGLDYHRDLNAEQRIQRYTEGDWKGGIPYDATTALGLAIAYSNGGWSGMFGGYSFGEDAGGMPYLALSFSW